MGCAASTSNDSPNGAPTTANAPGNGGPVMSMAELEAQRVEFWDSRVTGNTHMWNALRSAAEALNSNDASLATAIMTASNITAPNGTIELCYDELGNEYKIPTYCFTIPNNVVDTSKIAGGDKRTVTPAKNIKSEAITLKIRVNPGDYNMSVSVNTANTIAELKAAISTEASRLTSEEGNSFSCLCAEQRQRLIFLGKELKNAQYLADIGFDENRVVQVFLRPTPA